MEPSFWSRHLSQAFPRLYELFLKSDRTDLKNWFNDFSTKSVFKDTPPHQFLIDLERDLQELDATAWKEFLVRAASCMCIKDDWGWWTRLFECFNELHGYLYLKSEGYGEIRFIKEKPNIRTPDLYGHRDGKVAWLEVKTLHETHDANAYSLGKGKYEGKIKDAREIEKPLPDSMKKRLVSTIETARGQLQHDHPSLPHPVSRKIIFLLVWFDSPYVRRCHVNELRELLNHTGLKPIEIVQKVMNPILSEFSQD